MELTMASQADATPWDIPATSDQGSFSSPLIDPNPTPLELDTVLPGRAYFSQLGIVRRKPSRGDAPPTLSKSCSDKLSLHQCTSLLSSVTALLVSPEHAYISTLILPASQYSASGCRRAFSDGQGQDEDDKKANSQQARMAPLAVKPRGWNREGGYTFQPFSVKTTDLEFAFSRRSTVTLPPFSSSSLSPPVTDTSLNTPTSKIKITPSNLSVALTASNREETTLNGVLQGRKASEATIRGASFASRRRTWALAVEVAGLLSDDRLNTQQIQEALGIPRSSPTTSETTGTTESPLAKTYGDVKNTPLLEPRRHAKDVARKFALKGWVRNLGDEDFAL
ncbi:hypothetical protein E0Z10_g10331 [Xylaria hypoxylon]|uniref:A to I editase domain-containing protein n=1 Tax=Xylaria hypoxylon TaxID=37992 RepID=A0A4Z0YL95_9PEZI|nr:hypothetical protein E0Z10_g10331 [Xylaria hypoxylon]